MCVDLRERLSKSSYIISFTIEDSPKPVMFRILPVKISIYRENQHISGKSAIGQAYWLLFCLRGAHTSKVIIIMNAAERESAFFVVVFFVFSLSLSLSLSVYLSVCLSLSLSLLFFVCLFVFVFFFCSNKKQMICRSQIK